MRVFTPVPRKQKLYNTKFEFTNGEFNKIWQSKKVRNECKDDRLKLQALENEANKIAENLPYFTFEVFALLYHAWASCMLCEIKAIWNLQPHH